VRPLGVASRCSRHAAHCAEVPPRPFTARSSEHRGRDFAFLGDRCRGAGVWLVTCGSSSRVRARVQRECAAAIRWTNRCEAPRNLFEWNQPFISHSPIATSAARAARARACPRASASGGVRCMVCGSRPKAGKWARRINARRVRVAQGRSERRSVSRSSERGANQSPHLQRCAGGAICSWWPKSLAVWWLLVAVWQSNVRNLEVVQRLHRRPAGVWRQQR